MKKYYSLREVSQELNIPKSTLVKYKDFFSDFLPFVGDGKRKKLSEEGLDILRKIRDLRENENRDWLEIRDFLSEKYGEQGNDVFQPEIQQLPAPPPAPAISDKQLQHLNHLLFAMAGEMARTREKLEEIEGSIEKNTKRIRHHESTIAAAVMDVRSFRSQIEGAVERADIKNRRRFDAVVTYIRSEFQRVNKAIRAGAPQTPTLKSDQLKTITNLNDKIEKVIEDAALYQARYKLIKRENQVLRKKLGAGLPPGKGQPQGWRNMLKRKR
ncbi:MAG: MerR family transcriptional regulator [bacterium]